MARKRKSDLDRLTREQATNIYWEKLADAHALRDLLRQAIAKKLDPDHCSSEQWKAAGLPGEPKGRFILSSLDSECAELARRAGISHEQLEV